MKVSFSILSVVILMICFEMAELSAQIGVRLKYNSNKYNNWENVINERYSSSQKLLSPGYEIGVDYWFRLKKKRIEFMPEIFYGQSSTSYTDAELLKDIKATYIGFNFHTQIYALDLEGDCDCPTFSKGGSGIDKGLFFHFSPGLMYHTSTAEFDPISSFAVSPIHHLVLMAGVGVGVDFGMSDFLTVTPIVSYYFHSSMDWEEYLQSSANLSQLQFTLRLGFRPEYGRGRRR
jgi:hypothetical protein